MYKHEDAGVVERRAYNRYWRAKNRDRVKKYNENYWRRRAKKKKGGLTSATNENDQANHSTPAGE